MQDNQLMSWKDDSAARRAQFELSGDAIVFPVVTDAMVQEMADQCDIKKPHRQAILRRTQKQLRALHKKKDSLSEAQNETYMFAAFILWIDALIDGRHLEIRDGQLDPKALAREAFNALA